MTIELLSKIRYAIETRIRNSSYSIASDKKNPALHFYQFTTLLIQEVRYNFWNAIFEPVTSVTVTSL